MIEIHPSLNSINSNKNFTDITKNFANTLFNTLKDREERYVLVIFSRENSAQINTYALLYKEFNQKKGMILINIVDYRPIEISNMFEERWTVVEKQVVFKKVRSPRKQIHEFRKHLFEDFSAELALHLNTAITGHRSDTGEPKKNLQELIKCGVYFGDNWSTEEMLKFQNYKEEHKKNTVLFFNQETLYPPQGKATQNSIFHLITPIELTTKKLKLERQTNVYQEISNIVFYYNRKINVVSPSRILDLPYTKKQIELIESKPEIKKVKGVAGSGKTVVLINRAIHAYRRHKRPVLILTYNLTLKNYIISLILRHDDSLIKKGCIKVASYNAFIEDYINRYGVIAYRNTNNGEVTLPNRVPYKYASIFVDEIQDYTKLYVENIYKLLDNEDKTGELIFFGDEKQNIYNNKLVDGKNTFTGISGTWIKLPKVSFRGNRRISELANAFQKKFLSRKYDFEAISNPNINLFEEQEAVIKYYFEEDMFSGGLRTFDSIYKSLLQQKVINPYNICFLSRDGNILRSFNDYFNRGISTYERTNTMIETTKQYNTLKKIYPEGKALDRATQKIRRPLKLAFYGMKAGKITVSTIASFKGWEAETVCLLISAHETNDEGCIRNESIYTGITRACKNLIIFSNELLYDEFFKEHCMEQREQTVAGKSREADKKFLQSYFITENTKKMAAEMGLKL